MRLLTIFLEFLPWRPVAPSALLWGRSLLRSGRPPLREHFGCSLRLQFIQWNIHKSGLKVSEFGLPADATGPFVLSGYSGYKQVQVPRGRLFAFDSEGNYMLTCSATGGVIYKVPRGCPGGPGASSLEAWARPSGRCRPCPHRLWRSLDPDGRCPGPLCCRG